MTIAEKIQYAADIKVFTFFKEGLFYKCYNEDAMVFAQKVRAYKVKVKYVKSIDSEVLSLGFPISELEKENITLPSILEAIEATEYKEEPYGIIFSLKKDIKQNYLGISKETILYLLKQTIFNPVKENCHIKGSRTDWEGLPPSKSLFHYNNNTGLPIGNLTSQVFGNVYMNDFDHWVKKELGIKYYGRYVDDMVFVHNDKNYLQSIIPKLSDFLLSTLKLTIHPNKIVLVNANEGIQFLGQIIKPYRNYVSNRTKNNFYQAIQKINKTMAEFPEFSWQQLCDIRAVLNSYLGILQHAATFNLRKTMLDRLIGRFYDFFFVSKKLDRVIINEDFWLWHFSPSYRFIN